MASAAGAEVSEAVVAPEFQEWCERHGVVWNGIKAAFVAEGWRGIVATRDLQPGETVLRVPEQLLVTTRSARRSPTIAAALHALPGSSSLTPHQLLACHLLHEVSLGPASFWAPYLRQLPRSYTCLAHFTLEDVAALQLQYAVDTAEAAVERTREEWEGALPLLRQIGLPKRFTTLRAWAWASSTLHSRTMYLPWCPAGAMTPYGDLHNYQPPRAPYTPRVGAPPPPPPPADPPRGPNSRTATAQPTAVGEVCSLVAGAAQAQQVEGCPGDVLAVVAEGSNGSPPGRERVAGIGSGVVEVVLPYQQAAGHATKTGGPPSERQLCSQERILGAETGARPGVRPTPSYDCCGGRPSSREGGCDSRQAPHNAEAREESSQGRGEAHEAACGGACAQGDAGCGRDAAGRGAEALAGGAGGDEGEGKGQPSRESPGEAEAQVGGQEGGQGEAKGEGGGKREAETEGRADGDAGEEEWALAGDGCWDEGAGQYCISVRRPVRAGEQVFLCYGRHTNLELLEHYGFVLQDNPHDTAPLDPSLLDVPYSARHAPGAPHLAPADSFLHANGQPSWQLLHFLRYCAATPSERRTQGHLLAAGSCVSQQGEERVLCWLHAACKAQLASFDTTLEEDLRLMEQQQQQEQKQQMEGTGTNQQGCAGTSTSTPAATKQDAAVSSSSSNGAAALSDGLTCGGLALQWRVLHKRILHRTLQLTRAAVEAAAASGKVGGGGGARGRGLGPAGAPPLDLQELQRRMRAGLR